MRHSYYALYNKNNNNNGNLIVCILVIVAFNGILDIFASQNTQTYFEYMYNILLSSTTAVRFYVCV